MSYFTTPGFRSSVQLFLEDVRREFPEADVTAEYVEEVAGVFTENGRNFFDDRYGWVNHAVVSVADGAELSFFYKCFVDPITGLDFFAAAEEQVVELVSVEDFDLFREKYGSLIVEDGYQEGVPNEVPAPEVHLVCMLNEKDTPRYDALYVADGDIAVMGQPSLERAVDFAASRNFELRDAAWIRMLKTQGVRLPDGAGKGTFIENVRLVFDAYHPECMFEGGELDLAEVAEWVSKQPQNKVLYYSDAPIRYPEGRLRIAGLVSVAQDAAKGSDGGEAVEMESVR